MLHTTTATRRCATPLLAVALVLAASCATDADGINTDDTMGGATSSADSTSPASPGGTGPVASPGAASPIGAATPGAVDDTMGPEGIIPAVTATGGSATSGPVGSEVGAGGAAGAGGGGETAAVGGGPTAVSGEGGGPSDQTGEGGNSSDGSGGGGGSFGEGGEGGSASDVGGAGGSIGAGDPMPQSAGCGRTPSLTSGQRSIQTGGQSRDYILRIPDNYDSSRPYRLIFAYHWRGGTMQDVDGGGSSGAAWSYYGLREQADDSTIFVAPQGIGNGWQNAGGADLTFTDDMLELIQGDLCVDTRQIFALGFSYGGGMSYALACARPDVFRAVAVYSGGVLSGCEGGTQPVAYMGIHGLSDGTLDIAGGRSMRDRFVMNNGCTPQDPPEPNPGSLTYTCTAYQGCTSGYPVEWCAFDGGHTPGMVDGGGDDGARTWTKAEVWRFFTQFD